MLNCLSTLINIFPSSMAWIGFILKFNIFSCWPLFLITRRLWALQACCKYVVNIAFGMCLAVFYAATGKLFYTTLCRSVCFFIAIELWIIIYYLVYFGVWTLVTWKCMPGTDLPKFEILVDLVACCVLIEMSIVAFVQTNMFADKLN